MVSPDVSPDTSLKTEISTRLRRAAGVAAAAAPFSDLARSIINTTHSVNTSHVVATGLAATAVGMFYPEIKQGLGQAAEAVKGAARRISGKQ